MSSRKYQAADKEGPMKRKQRAIVVAVFLCISLFASSLGAAPAGETEEAKVYIVSVEKEVEAGLAQYIQRALSMAANDPAASTVILEIDTPGGVVAAAQNIRKAVEAYPGRIVALVKGGAISAGAYIALSCDLIAMQPGTTIGDAEPRLGNERADEKYLSYWRAEMSSLAEAHGRDKDIALAMVDRDMVIEGVKEAGKLLTLTAQEAYEVGYADHIVSGRDELKDVLGLADAKDVEVFASRGEQIARFLTNPYVASILLMLGLAGVIIEVFTTGFGVAGIVGGISLLLYFGGHLFAGFSGWGTILLLLAGVILLLIEAVVPGFGIFGVSGIICFAAGIVVTAPNLQTGLQSLVIAIIGTIVLLAIAFKFLAKKNVLNRLVLSLKFNKEQGYISQKKDYSHYLGQKARTVTDLRPAGIVVLDDGSRLDVVSDGSFIEKGQEVIITFVDGPRIVVTKNQAPEA